MTITTFSDKDLKFLSSPGMEHHHPIVPVYVKDSARKKQKDKTKQIKE